MAREGRREEVLKGKGAGEPSEWFKEEKEKGVTGRKGCVRERESRNVEGIRNNRGRKKRRQEDNKKNNK